MIVLLNGKVPYSIIVWVLCYRHNAISEFYLVLRMLNRVTHHMKSFKLSRDIAE